MTRDFWRLIDDTRPNGGGPTAHAEALTAALVDLGRESVIRFAGDFDQAMDALYTWDLWGAAYLSLGGCSDDEFEYLRAWIIGAGESAWGMARHDPQTFFVGLLTGADDPDRRWGEVDTLAGESLLYAAGIAHERLTGEWLPRRERPRPSEPAGDRWEEDQVPGLYPRLFAMLPAGWWQEESAPPDGAPQVMAQVVRGLDLFSQGDHLGAGTLLAPIVDDPALWAQVAEDRRVDVAYVVGIGRLVSGDVEGAAEALDLVESRLRGADHVRRALAQVELARGDLAGAARWIDPSPEAGRHDRVLAAKLAWRRGDHGEAIRRAGNEMATTVGPDEHPWDVAGSAYQIGQIFADAGDLDNAILAVGLMTRFLEGAPPGLPLLIQLQVLVAAITRLQGRPGDSLAHLQRLGPQLAGTDLAECLREQARAERALGRHEQAEALYREAVEVFEAAGERWEAQATRTEAGL